MKKTHLFIILPAVLFLVSGLVWAHESETDHKHEDNLRDKREEVRVEVREMREETRSGIKEVREDAESDIRSKKEELRESNLQARETLRHEIKQRREELKTTLETKREELKDRIETKREELKRSLESIKDERKRKVVERIDKRLDELNERLLNHYLKVLDKLDGILIRIIERVDRAEERGVDVSAVRVAIDEANRAIAVAKEAIENQTGKTYTIEISTEEGLKTDVGRIRRALHDDLAIVRATVKAAHDAVRNVAVALAHAMESAGPTLTPSPTVSPEPAE